MVAEAARAGRDRGVFGPLLGHALRTVRISAAIWIAGLALFGLVVVAAYESAYPTQPERQALAAQIEGNPSFEALFGRARDIDTLGGFAVWRINGIALILAGVWGMLAAARLTRAEEDAGHTELLASGVVGRRAPLAAALVVVLGSAAVLAGVVFGVLTVVGVEVRDAAQVGGGQGLLAATMAALTALVAQLAPTRGRTLALAGGLLAAAYLLRVLAVGADVDALLWLTPLGWAGELGFDPRPAALLPFAVAVPLLAGSALALVARRDLGGTALGYPSHDAGSRRPVRSAAALARRMAAPAALGWSVAIGAYALLFGLLTADMLEFFRESPGIVELVEQLGLGSLDEAEGVLGFAFSIIVFLVALVAAHQAGAIREEEASGRVETLLVLPLSRARWLAGRIAAAAGSLVVAAAATGLGAGIGVAIRGESADPWRLVVASANLLPVALLFLGLAVAAFGLRPRSTAPLAWGLVIGSFLVEFVGSVLELPDWALVLSPFHHVDAAPAVTPSPGPPLVMLALAGAGILVGLVAFRRRDLVGP
jgi:ABC-2 type transport system permease protein